jgi:hypothetical protein
MTPIYTEARARAEALQGGPMTDDVILNPGQEIWLFKPVAEPGADGESLIAVSETDVWQIGSAPDALELIGAEMPLDDDTEAGIAGLIAGISAPEEVG